jgi:hypothetical protein
VRDLILMTRISALLGKCTFLGLLAVVLCSVGLSQVSVLTQHNDNNRTGQNTAETMLTTSNVNVSNFGKLFALAVDGYIYAQPLYLPNVTIGGSLHNVVYAATEHNSVYAFDADDSNGTTLWQVNLGPSVPSDDICGSSGCYTDLTPEIGITGTPVIDPQGGVLYVAVKNKDSDGSYHYRLHALNVSSGAEMLNGPAEISAANFAPLFEMNRPGLLLAGGNVYVAFGSVGDTSPWYGFVMAYNASTLAQVAVRNTSPSLISGGSIWGGGQGPVADIAGSVYVITANGDFNANTGGSDYGTSFLKLDGSSLSVMDYFTPSNQATLGNFDLDIDLGAGGPLLIPGTTLILGGGKDGILRLVDSAKMGGFNSNYNADVQEWQAISGRIMGAPVYWNSPTLGPVVYMWGDGEPLRAWSFNGQTFQTSPVSQSTILNTAGYSNLAPLSISSNGNTTGSGIVWAATSLTGNANAGTVPGQLWAFDAGNLTNELWDSQQDSARDAVGNFAKFAPPTVANGKVYLPTFSNQLLVYGLLSSLEFSMSTAPSSQSVVAGSSASYIVYVNPQAGFTGTVAVTCSGLPSGASCSPASVSVPSGSSGQLSAQLTVTTTTSTGSASFSFTITGTSGTLVQTTAASLTVTAATPSFALTAAALVPAIITPGGSATSTVTVAPSGGFNATVNLTCAVTPATAVPPKCSFSSATVSGGSGTPTLTVSTVAVTASVRPNGAVRMYYAVLLPVCGLTLLGARFRSRSRKPLGWLLLCLMLSGLVWLAACSGGTSSSGAGGNGGGGGGGTTAGSYTVTVTGTAGTLTQTQPLAVTIQ